MPMAPWKSIQSTERQDKDDSDLELVEPSSRIPRELPYMRVFSMSNDISGSVSNVLMALRRVGVKNQVLNSLDRADGHLGKGKHEYVLVNLMSRKRNKLHVPIQTTLLLKVALAGPRKVLNRIPRLDILSSRKLLVKLIHLALSSLP